MMEVDRGARLAFMLCSSTGAADEAFVESLRARQDEVRELAASFDATARIGTRYPRDLTSKDSSKRRVVEPTDGAVEISTNEDGLLDLCAHAKELGALLVDVADIRRSIVTVGIMHRIVEPRPGDLFLSLTFKREPGTPIEEMHDWWLNQHTVVACRFMLPEMLAYDQVHVDHELSERASIEAGFEYRAYDSYDNLTWGSIDDYFKSRSKPGSAEAIYADEVGHLDHDSYVGSLMNVLS